MLSTTSLRLGNLIQLNSSIITVTPAVLQQMEANPYMYKDIPITVALLKNSNFTERAKSVSLFEYERDGIFMQLEGNCWWWSLANGDYRDNIQSVHSLQNLYYLITGEELALNLIA